MSYIKVKQHNNLVRDTRTKAILNTDMVALLKSRKEKQMSVTLSSLAQEVDIIKDEFKEIKTLLKQIVGKKK